MQWYGMRIKIILLAFILGLAGLVGANWLYGEYGSNQSLRQALGESKIVESFTFDDKGASLLIIIQVKPSDDLMTDYQTLQRTIEMELNGRPYQLVVEDQRSKALTNALYRSQFAVHQAIVQGSFPDMAAAIERNAEAVDADAEVFVDNRNIYVQLTGQGDAFLVEIIPRGSETDRDFTGLNGGGLYV